MGRGVQQYLARYATSVDELVARVRADYDHVLVVPACDEDPGFVEGLRPALGVRALVVVVVNGTDAHDPTVHRRNEQLLRMLPPTLGRSDVLTVDRASAGRRFPEQEGVGLARRIGLDLGLALQAAGRVRSPWLHTTDADVVLPASYFDTVAGVGEAVAVHHPYWHVPGGDPLLDLATAHYEVWLRYWVAGLRWAGSPDAHPTIGSCLAVRGTAYAAVRGVPRRRRAGEDFHLVAKLAKHGRVATPGAAPIRIRSRRSDRVPFGTGPGVEQRAAALRAGAQPVLPDPRAFTVVRAVLRWIDAVAAEPDGGRVDEPVDLGVSMPATVARRIVATCNIRDGVRATRPGGGGAAGRRRRARERFDALATVRLIHAVRDALAPDLPWSEAIDAAPFVAAPTASGPLLHGLRRALSRAGGSPW